jgi:hypothetical protein
VSYFSKSKECEKFHTVIKQVISANHAKMPSACAPKASCGVSGSSSSAQNCFGSGTKDPGCSDTVECKEYSTTFSGEQVVTICKCGRYVVPDGQFVAGGPNTVLAFFVPHHADSNIVVDLTKLTKAVAAAREAYLAPGTNFPASYPATLVTPGTAIATGTPATTVIIPRVRVVNKSDNIVRLTTGSSDVTFEGVHRQIGAHGGEVLDVMYSPVQNAWVLVSHYHA